VERMSPLERGRENLKPLVFWPKPISPTTTVRKKPQSRSEAPKIFEVILCLVFNVVLAPFF